MATPFAINAVFSMPEYETGVQEVLPEGDYDFVVDDAGEKESSKGNPMIELQLAIEHNAVPARLMAVSVGVIPMAAQEFGIASGSAPGTWFPSCADGRSRLKLDHSLATEGAGGFRTARWSDP
jgi:hypothetical protein